MFPDTLKKFRIWQRFTRERHNESPIPLSSGRYLRSLVEPRQGWQTRAHATFANNELNFMIVDSYEFYLRIYL